jgi:alpha-mannosidase
MVQIGGFNFGRKQERIPREANPLLLAWPINNYWDTNFAASQPGFIHLHYKLMTHGQFNSAAIMQQAQTLLAHPLIVCPQVESGILFQLDNPNIHVLHVKPAANNAGTLIRLVNLSPETETATLTFPGRRVQSACYTTTTEVDTQSLPIRENRIQLQLSPRQIVSLRVVVEAQGT